MGRRKNPTGAGMSAQRPVTATNRGYEVEQSSLRVATRGHTSGMSGAAQTICNATARTSTTSQNELICAVAKTEDTKEEQESLLHSRHHGQRRSSEGMKAKAKYKAALKIRIRLQDKTALTPEEKEQLAWAEERIEEGRLHFAKLANMTSTGGFANKVEEMLANKRQSTAESAAQDTPVCKRQCGPKAAGPPPKAEGPAPKAAGPSPKARERNRKAETRVSEVSKRHLIVALVDRNDKNGQMTEAQWKTVHARLLESLFARMEEDPNAVMPTFDGAGWLNGIKILKCMDDLTRRWLTQTVCKLEGLWQGAKLEVVGRELIPSLPKAKVLFPIAMQIDQALKLLQRQNPDVPTADWKILDVSSQLPKEGGQCAILQINKEAEDILYPRYGKMAWGMGSVYLRLKKRHPGDMDAHTLQAGEVEKDLGLDTIMRVNESVEDHDLTITGEHSTYDAQSAAAQPP